MSTKLRRSVSLTGLIFYGVGTMVGGGIYALLGKVAHEAGVFSPWAMLLAGVLAVFSALTFSELASRLPFSGGPAKYISEAFQHKTLGTIFGWLVIATGVVSAATLTVAMSGFFLDLLGLSVHWGKLIVVLLLLSLACWGIKQSVTAVAIVTSIEVIGLLLVVGINMDALANPDLVLASYIPSFDPLIWTGILTGGFIAFYAFIGFEDMVTLAEEVKGSERNVPKAIVISLLVTLLLYIMIAFVAVVSSDLSLFASSNTPMAYLVRESTWLNPQVLVIISLLAGFNGALVQVIMSSRVLYGMAADKQAPALFSKLNPTTQTPIVASLLTAAIVYSLSISLDLVVLAKLTSGIILFVFAAMNLSLIKIKLVNEKHGSFKVHKGFKVPLWVPIVGLIVSAGSLVFAIFNASIAGH